MNNENKELILDALRTTSGIIDKVTFYYATAGAGALWSVQTTITWSAAADGSLAMSGTIDFENTGATSINPAGFALLNSGATTLVDTGDAVSIYALPGGSIVLEPGEIIRITTMEYTVD